MISKISFLLSPNAPLDGLPAEQMQDKYSCEMAGLARSLYIRMLKYDAFRVDHDAQIVRSKNPDVMPLIEAYRHLAGTSSHRILSHSKRVSHESDLRYVASLQDRLEASYRIACLDADLGSFVGESCCLEHSLDDRDYMGVVNQGNQVIKHAHKWSASYSQYVIPSLDDVIQFERKLTSFVRKHLDDPGVLMEAVDTQLLMGQTLINCNKDSTRYFRKARAYIERYFCMFPDSGDLGLLEKSAYVNHILQLREHVLQ